MYITLAVLLLAVSVVAAGSFESKLDNPSPRYAKGIGVVQNVEVDTQPLTLKEIKQKFQSRKANILSSDNWEKLLTPRFLTADWQTE